MWSRCSPRQFCSYAGFGVKLANAERTAVQVRGRSFHLFVSVELDEQAVAGMMFA